MRIAVLSSSRADYGIYLPLLKRMRNDESIELTIIAFGSHCSHLHGNTVNAIKQDGFEVRYEIDNLIPGDTAEDIAKSFANTCTIFSSFWQKTKNDFDWVLCLGDRFEMAAAVISSIPYQIKFAHFYAGDTTLGAIDNIYRHQISLASKLHFCSLSASAKRTEDLLGFNGTTTVIGNLSLLNLKEIPFLSISEFQDKWGIDLNKKSVLVTVHPETVHYELNAKFSLELKQALEVIAGNYQLIITLPNADTDGSEFRKMFYDLKVKLQDRIHLIESFGTQSYFTCMKYAAFLLGNTSSGIVEAASFNKFVLNVGDRQKGRFAPQNVISIPFESNSIIEAATSVDLNGFSGTNPYDLGDTTELILEKIKNNE